METSENQRKFICGMTHRYLKRDEKLRQLPNYKCEGEIIFVWQWKKRIKGQNVYVFSALKDDRSNDKLKPKRVKIYDELLTSPLSHFDFEGSINDYF